MLSRRLPFLRFSRHSLVPVVSFNFIAYLIVGLPIAVIPLFMVEILHFNTVWAGLAVSLQYFATFASRPQAGKRIDLRGPKTVVIAGLVLCVFSGVLLLLSGLMAHLAFLSLFTLFASRCALGWGESWTTTAPIIWNIRRAGPSRTAQAISWNGVTSYGASPSVRRSARNSTILAVIGVGSSSSALSPSSYPSSGLFMRRAFPK
ncbi:MAG: MFS transporter [Acetobacteraceae bacterium]